MAMDEDKLARGHSRQRQDHEDVGAKLDEARLAAIRQALSRGGDADVVRQVGADALGTPEYTAAVRQRNESLASRQKEALARPGKAAESRDVREGKIRRAERRSAEMQQRLHEQTGRTLEEHTATSPATRSQPDTQTPREARAALLERGRQELNQAGRQSQQSREQGGRDRVRSR